MVYICSVFVSFDFLVNVFIFLNFFCLAFDLWSNSFYITYICFILFQFVLFYTIISKCNFFDICHPWCNWMSCRATCLSWSVSATGVMSVRTVVLFFIVLFWGLMWLHRQWPPAVVTECATTCVVLSSLRPPAVTDWATEPQCAYAIIILCVLSITKQNIALRHHLAHR